MKMRSKFISSVENRAMDDVDNSEGLKMTVAAHALSLAYLYCRLIIMSPFWFRIIIMEIILACCVCFQWKWCRCKIYRLSGPLLR